MRIEDKKYIFEKSVQIKGNSSALFNFHCDTNNALFITPAFLNTKILSISEIPLRIGSRVELENSFLFMKTIWVIEITDFVFNKLIEDSQLIGPFKYWVHQHKFEQTTEATILTDRIVFSPKLKFLSFIQAKIISFILNLMFIYRHKKTSEIFKN